MKALIAFLVAAASLTTAQEVAATADNSFPELVARNPGQQEPRDTGVAQNVKDGGMPPAGSPGAQGNAGNAGGVNTPITVTRTVTATAGGQVAANAQLATSTMSQGQMATIMPENGTSHTVKVGGSGGLTFQPDHLDNVHVGDVVVFEFYSHNHTVTQSSFDVPCSPIAGGMDSGFLPNPDNKTSPPPHVSLKVLTTQPLWFYCRQRGHCGKGMVFAINPDAFHTFDIFRNLAISESSFYNNQGNSNTGGTPANGSPSPGSPQAQAPAADPGQGQGGAGYQANGPASSSGPAQEEAPGPYPGQGQGGASNEANGPASAGPPQEQLPAPPSGQGQGGASNQANGPAPAPAPASLQGQGQGQGDAGIQASGPASAPPLVQGQGDAGNQANGPASASAPAPAPAPAQGQGDAGNQANGTASAPGPAQAQAPAVSSGQGQGQGQGSGGPGYQSNGSAPTPAPAQGQGDGGFQANGTASAPSPAQGQGGSGVTIGQGTINPDGSCQCVVSCNPGGFPNAQAQGIGSYGGMGGSLPLLGTMA